jgi:hypothetical protein
MATFPTLTPSSRTFTPGRHPHSEIPTLNGLQTRVRTSNVILEQRLTAHFHCAYRGADAQHPQPLHGPTGALLELCHPQRTAQRDDNAGRLSPQLAIAGFMAAHRRLKMSPALSVTTSALSWLRCHQKAPTSTGLSSLSTSHLQRSRHGAQTITISFAAGVPGVESPGLILPSPHRLKLVLHQAANL